MECKKICPLADKSKTIEVKYPTGTIRTRNFVINWRGKEKRFSVSARRSGSSGDIFKREVLGTEATCDLQERLGEMLNWRGIGGAQSFGVTCPYVRSDKFPGTLDFSSSLG